MMVVMIPMQYFHCYLLIVTFDALISANNNFVAAVFVPHHHYCKMFQTVVVESFFFCVALVLPGQL